MAKAKKTAASRSGDEVYVSFVSNVPNHTRELSAADFKRAGVEHGKVSCGAGEVVKVSREAADYLIDDLGEFEEVDPSEVEDSEEEPDNEGNEEDKEPTGDEQ